MAYEFQGFIQALVSQEMSPPGPLIANKAFPLAFFINQPMNLFQTEPDFFFSHSQFLFFTANFFSSHNFSSNGLIYKDWIEEVIKSVIIQRE